MQPLGTVLGADTEAEAYDDIKDVQPTWREPRPCTSFEEDMDFLDVQFQHFGLLFLTNGRASPSAGIVTRFHEWLRRNATSERYNRQDILDRNRIFWSCCTS